MNIIVSVAFRPVYLKHSTNQLRYLEGFDTLYFHDELPMKDCIHTDNIVEEFQKSLYGFKPHAIQRAIDKGATKVIWVDPSVLPTSSPKILFDALDEYPVLVRNNDGYLDKMANKKAKDYFGITEDKAAKIKSTGGTIYGFNFNNPKAVEVFNLWKQAEEDGIFGTQDEFMKGHWADEACLALAMNKCGVERNWVDFKYLNQKEL